MLLLLHGIAVLLPWSLLTIHSWLYQPASPLLLLLTVPACRPPPAPPCSIMMIIVKLLSRSHYTSSHGHTGITSMDGCCPFHFPLPGKFALNNNNNKRDDSRGFTCQPTNERTTTSHVLLLPLLIDILLPSRRRSWLVSRFVHFARSVVFWWPSCARARVLCVPV